MFTNAKASELSTIQGTVALASTAAGTVTSGWIQANKFHDYLATILTGTLGASATVDAKLQQATDSSGTGVKDITGKAITQIVKASGDNVQAQINLRPQELDVNNGFQYFRLSVTVGTATSVIGGLIEGIVPRYAPASDAAPASLVQIVG